MPIILREHDGHGPPRHHFHVYWIESALTCDCYDGTEDAGWQRTAIGFGSTVAECWVWAALRWNECIEENEQ
jgi:hypothetical protein